MWNYLKSFIWAEPAHELSLEEAISILNEENEPVIEDTVEEEILNEYDSCLKIGKITHKNGNSYKIDEIYPFELTSDDVVVGSKVSYKLFISLGEIQVVDVKLIENDWDVVFAKKSTWCNRTILVQVEEKYKRTIKVKPGGILIDLNKVHTEFIPIVGDWLELDAKCEINEDVADLSGSILEINKISPVRPHVQTGVINFWNAEDNIGVINNKIYFNKESFSWGYIPVKADKVVVEIIESEQGVYTWRAIKIIPEYLSKTIIENELQLSKDEINKHSNVSVKCDTVRLQKLNEVVSFNILLENVSEKSFLVKSVEFPKSNGQCKVVTTFDTPLELNTNLTISCECQSRNIGESSEYVSVIFEDFTIGHWINIVVGAEKGQYNSRNNSFHSNRYQKPSNRQVVKGRQVKMTTRFVANRIPNYALPKRLLDVFDKYDLRDLKLQDELRVCKPSLFSGLSFMNYEDKMHTLIYLDEISHMIALRKYEKDRECFIVNNEYLMMEIENLHERRPSIIVGDKIIASSLMSSSKVDFEGVVHKIGAKHVYLKFSPLFHDSYRGEDYSIRVECSRSMFKRMHHAIYLSMQHLGKDVLFPTQIVEKQAQVNIAKEERRKLTPKQVLNKINEYKNNIKNESNKEQQSNIQSSRNIEWYNNNLNYYQKLAIRNILLGVARPLPYIIFGPPGTGKTVTIIEGILQILRMIPQSRILVATPSNSAADLIALRLIESGVLKPGDLIRIVSNNYLMSEQIVPLLVPYCATGSVAKEGTADDNQLAESGMMLGCNSSFVGRHKITITTCGSAGSLFAMGFPRGHFTHIIVDEAGQGVEPEVLIPLSFMDRLSGQIILAGDPVQLGPIILNNTAEQCGLGESYLERLINRFPYVRDPEGFPESGGYDPRLVTKLRYNYRSLAPILKLTSSLFYNDDLIPTLSMDDSEEVKLLRKLKEILPKSNNQEVPCTVFHGVNGQNFQTEDSPSWYNPQEAAQVFFYVNELYRLGLKKSDIGIISPYTKQVHEIRNLLKEAEFDVPKSGTVEEFQGQEFDVILLSTVRSSQSYVSSDVEHNLGFVSSPRRLNVAISRAKSLLIIIGNPNLLSRDGYWRSVLDYCIKQGGYTGCKLKNNVSLN